MANYNFVKGDYVLASKDNKNYQNGTITAIKKSKVGGYLFKVGTEFYRECEISHIKPKFFSPTPMEMAEIKKAYPILRTTHIKVMFECGHDTPSGFKGVFGFAYEKGDQKGNLLFNNGVFTPMKKEMAMKYGF